MTTVALPPPPVDVADSLRGLEAGMANLQQELELELEQIKLNQSSGTAGGGRLGPPGQRQAAFTSELEAAAARRSSDGAADGAAADGASASSGGDGASPSAAGPAAADGEPPLPPFAAMLGAFLQAAVARREELQAASQATTAEARSVAAWLGEPAGSEAELAAAFELLFSFCAQFDLCVKKVQRQMVAAAPP